MSDSEEELDSDEVPGFGPEQVWNACGFFVQSSDFFEKPFDGDLAYRMITTLEDRELTESDLCVELLHLTPVESSPQRGGVFSAEPPPPCSTLADCLLRRAAALGRPDTVALMLSQGARLDFDASVLEYWACLGTPLVNACEVGNVDIVCMLLDRDADTNAWTRSCQFDSVDDGFIVRMDWTALHAACAWGRLETVQLLVERRADISAHCRYHYSPWPSDGEVWADQQEDGPSAFHLACARGHLDVVAFLHETVGASLESMGSIYGWSLVGAEELVVLDWHLNSPLIMGPDRQDHYSEKPNCSCGYITFPNSYQTCTMDQHISAGEFPCVSINSGRVLTGTPLLLACVRGYTDVIHYLLDAGADADTRGHHLALCPVCAEDLEACTPLDILKAFGHTDVSELLLSVAAGSARKGARATPMKTRAERAGIQLDETPPAVRRDIAEGGPVTRAKAKAEMRAVQKSRVQRVTRAEQAGTVSAALFRAKDVQRQATKRASEPSKASGSRRVYTCKKCGEPKKGHVCQVK